MNEAKIVEEAVQMGFSGAAFIPAAELTVVPEYRKYCEMNLCHRYNVHPACPPQCGTVEEMSARMRKFQRVLVLQTVCENSLAADREGAMRAKREHNKRAERLLRKILSEETAEYLCMSAGPWKNGSCMSAYCIDAQKMAEAAGMTCWTDDGKTRFFSQILFG